MLATGAVVWAAGFTAWVLTAPGYSDGQTILEANPEATVWVAVTVVCGSFNVAARRSHAEALAVGCWAWMTAESTAAKATAVRVFMISPAGF